MGLKEDITALSPVEQVALFAELIGTDDVKTSLLAASKAAGSRFFTQDDIDEKLVPRAVAPKLKQIESLTANAAALQAELDRARNELASAADAGKKKAAADDDQISAATAPLQQQIEEIKSMLTDSKKALEAEQSDRMQAEHLRNIGTLLLENGAQPGLIDQSTEIAARKLEKIQTTRANGKYVTQAVDALGDPTDVSQLVATWLRENKHFAKPEPGGAGAPGGKPPTGPPPKEHPFTDKAPGEEQITVALNALAAKGGGAERT